MRVTELITSPRARDTSLNILPSTKSHSRFLLEDYFSANTQVSKG